MSTNLNEIFAKLLKEKASTIYNFLIDKNELFKSIIYELNSNDIFQIEFLDYDSLIVLKKLLNKKDPSKIFILYTTEEIDITSYIAKASGTSIRITATDIFRKDKRVSKKLSEEINLSNDQFKFFINYYEKVIEKTKLENQVNQNSLENILMSLYLGDPSNLEEVVINIITGKENLNDIKEIGLYDHLLDNIQKQLNINLYNIYLYTPNLFNKILLSLSKITLGDKFPVALSSEILNVNNEELYKLFNIIKNNSYDFRNNINSLFSFIGRNIDENCDISHIDYYTPYFFEKFIYENLENYQDININENYLWCKEMYDLGTFIMKLQKLSKLLEHYISFNLNELSMDYIINAYKEKIYLIDQLFRKISSLQEEFLLSNNRILNKIAHSKILQDLQNNYFDVLNKVNSSYIKYYPDLIKNQKNAFSQANTFKEISITENTVIIISDGLRYEMSRDIINKDEFDIIDEYPIYSEIPSDTEVCYNSYFIDKEKIVLNDNNTYELRNEQDKRIFQIKEWRLEKARKFFGDVIEFSEFKVNENYHGIVLFQQNIIDDAIHRDKDFRDITKGISDIKEVILYCYKRGFDVLLLSDHGFINVKNKINEGNKNIISEKKKDRYLLTDKNENIDYAFYVDNYPIPDFLECFNKKIWFINSINTLRKTGRYTHGGISLQENIIPAFHIKHKKQNQNTEKKIIEIESSNELKFMIVNINLDKEYFVQIFKNNKIMKMDHIYENNQMITYPMRTAKPGDIYLAILLENEIEIERKVFEKKNIRSIDSDLDIF